jgi:hypothetical protein
MTMARRDFLSGFGSWTKFEVGSERGGFGIPIATYLLRFFSSSMDFWAAVLGVTLTTSKTPDMFGLYQGHIPLPQKEEIDLSF